MCPKKPRLPSIDAAALPDWLGKLEPGASAARELAESQAAIARGVFCCLGLFLVGVVALSQVAYRQRFARIIAAHPDPQPEEPDA